MHDITPASGAQVPDANGHTIPLSINVTPSLGQVAGWTNRVADKPEDQTRLLEQGLKLLAMGYSIVPVRSDGSTQDKTPLVAWKKFQTERPTPDDIRNWIQGVNTFNYARPTGWALICGKLSGVSVLDVDPRHGGDEAMKKLIAEGVVLGEPATITGSGGCHFYYRFCPVKKGPLTGDYAGLDLQSDLAYAVLPGSWHGKAQRQYAFGPGWKDDPSQYPELPDRIVEIRDQPQEVEAASAPVITETLDLHSHPPHGQQRLQLPGDLAQFQDGVAAGQRNDAGVRLAGHFIRQDPNEERVLARLRAWNRLNRPPMDDNEVVMLGSEATRAAWYQEAREGHAGNGGGREDAAPTQQVDNGDGDIANHVVDGWTKNRKPIISAVPIVDIAQTMYDRTGGWPRRLDDLLFVAEAGGIRYLESSDELFAWIAGKRQIRWRTGSDRRGRTLTPKREFFAHLKGTATDYVAIETLPHEPTLVGHFYAWQPPIGYSPAGEHLEKLLSFFGNAETRQDAELIKALFLTPAWGAQPGSRPAFAITSADRGEGKTTLAKAVAELYGGPLDFDRQKYSLEKFKGGLLSPNALSKRVVIADNLKSLVEGEMLEGLITTREINGWRAYHGNASRPNTLTWIATGNALELSRDMASRSFIIRLRKPVFQAEWEERLFRHLEGNRDRILADIVMELRKPGVAVRAKDRWMAFCRDVLSKCTSAPDLIILQNQARRDEHDEDVAEAATILETISAEAQARAASASGQVQGSNAVFIPSRAMTCLINAALNLSLSDKKVHQMLKSHMGAGRLPGVQRCRRGSSRGYVVTV